MQVAPPSKTIEQQYLRLTQKIIDDIHASFFRRFDSFADDVKKITSVDALTPPLTAIANASHRVTSTAIQRVTDRDIGVLAPARRREFIERNVDLIQSLGIDARRDLEDAIEQTRGLSVTDQRRMLEQHFLMPRARADLIARDQTLKFLAQSTQEGYESLGIFEYIWTTAGDARVREDHAMLDGKRYEYSDPPIVDRSTGERANPGEHFQCRCIAFPVLVI